MLVCTPSLTSLLSMSKRWWTWEFNAATPNKSVPMYDDVSDNHCLADSSEYSLLSETEARSSSAADVDPKN